VSTVATIEGVRTSVFTGTLPDLRWKTVNAYFVADGMVRRRFEPAADARPSFRFALRGFTSLSLTAPLE
jgi:hypothetical protein